MIYISHLDKAWFNLSYQFESCLIMTNFLWIWLLSVYVCLCIFHLSVYVSGSFVCVCLSVYVLGSTWIPEFHFMKYHLLKAVKLRSPLFSGQLATSQQEFWLSPTSSMDQVFVWSKTWGNFGSCHSDAAKKGGSLIQLDKAHALELDFYTIALILPPPFCKWSYSSKEVNDIESFIC